MRKKNIVAAGVATILGLSLFGCSGGDAPGSDASVSIPSKDPTATIHILSFDAKKYANVVAAFEKAHPTISVVYDSVPFDDLNAAIESRVSSKSGSPDVYWADEPRISALAARGYTTDLSGAFSEYRKSWDDSAVEAVTVGGHLQAVPIATSTMLLFYNKDLLDKAGVAAPSDDHDARTTWEQLAADAKKAVDAGAANGILMGQFDRYFQLEPLAVGLGGSPGATGKDLVTPDITSDAWVKALTWYGSIFADGAAPRATAADQSDATFAAGQAAYFIQGPWTLPNLSSAKFNWGVAYLPKFANGKPVTPTGSWALAMNPFSKNKEAAAIFMKYMSVDHRDVDPANADMPVNKAYEAAYYDQPIYQTPQGKTAQEIMKYEAANTAVNRLRTVGYVEFEDITGRAFADIRNGADPKTALTQASAELTSAWAKYKN
jgi:ABC-type glycerol-3-phosphate transport system substrate-binding protein